MRQHNVALNWVQVYSDVSNDELCQLTLKAAKEVKILGINSKTTPDFKPREVGAFDNLEKLDLHRANWFSVDHLVNHFMDCPEISLTSSKLSIHDLNIFFKKWVEGSKIESFHWSPMGDSDETLPILAEVLVGIPCVALKKIKSGRRTVTFKDNYCFMIEQVGGNRAMVFKSMYPVIMLTDFSLDFERKKSMTMTANE